MYTIFYLAYVIIFIAQLTYHEAFVIVYDLIFSKSFRARGPSTRLILQHKNGLLDMFETITKTSTEKSSSETSRK